MIPFFRKITRLLCVVFAVLTLSGCGIGEPEETTHPTLEPIVLPTAPKETEATVAPEFQEEHLSVIMDAGDLYTLDYYPYLKTVDLSLLPRHYGFRFQAATSGYHLFRFSGRHGCFQQSNFCRSEAWQL